MTLFLGFLRLFLALLSSCLINVQYASSEYIKKQFIKHVKVSSSSITVINVLWLRYFLCGSLKNLNKSNSSVSLAAITKGLLPDCVVTSYFHCIIREHKENHSSDSRPELISVTHTKQVFVHLLHVTLKKARYLTKLHNQTAFIAKHQIRRLFHFVLTQHTQYDA